MRNLGVHIMLLMRNLGVHIMYTYEKFTLVCRSLSLDIILSFDK